MPLTPTWMFGLLAMLAYTAAGAAGPTWRWRSAGWRMAQRW
jgi:hypothetical protein